MFADNSLAWLDTLGISFKLKLENAPRVEWENGEMVKSGNLPILISGRRQLNKSPFCSTVTVAILHGASVRHASPTTMAELLRHLSLSRGRSQVRSTRGIFLVGAGHCLLRCQPRQAALSVARLCAQQIVGAEICPGKGLSSVGLRQTNSSQRKIQSRHVVSDLRPLSCYIIMTLRRSTSPKKSPTLAAAQLNNTHTRTHARTHATQRTLAKLSTHAGQRATRILRPRQEQGLCRVDSFLRRCQSAFLLFHPPASILHTAPLLSTAIARA